MGLARAGLGAGLRDPDTKNKGDWDGRPCTRSAETQLAKTVKGLGKAPFQNGAQGCSNSLLKTDRAPITGIAMGKGPSIGPAEAMANHYFFKISILFKTITPACAS
jgi:hypothetical protein